MIIKCELVLSTIFLHSVALQLVHMVTLLPRMQLWVLGELVIECTFVPNYPLPIPIRRLDSPAHCHMTRGTSLREDTSLPTDVEL